MELIQINSDSLENTTDLAKKIGSRLKGGEIIELVGDLGSGKTTFVSGLVKGANSDDIVSSPTFVISKIYTNDKLRIYHYDLYRLDQADLTIHELKDIMAFSNSVILIEWPGVIDSFLDVDKMIIEFKYEKDINKRLIEIKYNKSLEYLIK
jgi:tRNA threonylcarbamoyladenosine biosynthesis protein TsaE